MGDRLNEQAVQDLNQPLRSSLASFGSAVVCTTTAPSPWTRTWCVYEFACNIAAGKQVNVAPSRAFVVDPPNGFAGFMDLHTETCKSSNPNGEEFIRKEAA